MRASSLVATSVLTLFAFGAEARSPDQGTDRFAEIERRLIELEIRQAQTPKDISVYQLPEKAEFCGEPLDLGDPEIRERLEREFYQVLGDRAQVVLWTKRATRVFPAVEAQARAMGTCDDLKYLAVSESGLRPAVTSTASARGWWQFMSTTGRQYGLDVDRAWDQRADLEQSTRAGLTFLDALHGEFGSWTMAMAAYNVGPGRLQRVVDAQGENDFWDLDLQTETERYVARTVAIKMIMSDLDGYGFRIDLDEGYAPRQTARVEIEIPRGHHIEVLDAARQSGIRYRTLRRMNPELGTDAFPHGRQIVLEVPEEKAEPLRRWMTGEIDRQAELAKARGGDRNETTQRIDAVEEAGAIATR